MTVFRYDARWTVMDRTRIKKIILCCLLGMTAQVFSSYALGFILDMIPGAAVRYSADIENLLENEVFTVLRVALLFPVLEELIFRFLIMGFLRRHCPFIAANLIQAAIFGIYHMNVVQGIYAFLLGLLIGSLMEESQTILACIGFHIVFNISGLLLDDLAGDNNSGIAYIAAALMSLAVCIYLYLRIRSREKT